MSGPDLGAIRYSAFFSSATKNVGGPFDYQRKLAESDWPHVLRIPTGLGKTAAVVVAWLYKRLVLQDIHTPCRLVYCLPMRVLVEQTLLECEHWLNNLNVHGESGEGRVSVHALMSGSDDIKKAVWAEHPEENQILLGTQDMLLSRALMRGYGMSRYQWPVHFAMLHNDAMWVFDEVQLMGPGLITSVQLEAFRREITCYRNCRSLWVSATLNHAWMNTVDFDANTLRSLELSEAEKTSPVISSRRDSVKPIAQSPISLSAEGKSTVTSYLVAMSEQVLSAHRPGTTTLAILNTVERAQGLLREIRARVTAPSGRNLKKSHDGLSRSDKPVPELLLLHSRFRSAERAGLNRKLLSCTAPDGAGRIIIATQAIEAGVDLSARVLFTEIAPWASMVQRFGRCNRYGEFNESGDAQIFWIDVLDAKPYDAKSLEGARQLLHAMNSAAPSVLPAVGPEASLHPVLRRKDFLDLFTTESDLSGLDIDISQYIRDADDADVFLFWREWDDIGGARGEPPAAPAELCRAGMGAATKLLGRLRSGDVYRWDTLSQEWTELPGLGRARLRPGMTLMVRASAGGYSAESGLAAESTDTVPVVVANTDTLIVEALDDEHRSLLTRAVTLPQHLADVEEAARTLCESLHVTEASAVVRAARWHDVGKAHSAFQSMLHTAHRQCTDGSLGAGLWAKSGRTPDPATGAARRPGRPVYQVDGETRPRRHFRHELASALAWLAEHDNEPDADLIAYLIAAHHGKLRLSLRALPNEIDPRDARLFARGVWHGDTLPEIKWQDGQTLLPGTPLYLDLMRLGDGPQGPSWTMRTQRLLNTYGPFRLAWLESLVRVADWRATRAEQEAGGGQ